MRLLRFLVYVLLFWSAWRVLARRRSAGPRPAGPRRGPATDAEPAEFEVLADEDKPAS